MKERQILFSGEMIRALLDVLLGLEGFVVLSGDPSDLYEQALAGWERHTTGSRISAGRGTAVRTECVWLNPACSRALHQNDLFKEIA